MTQEKRCAECGWPKSGGKHYDRWGGEYDCPFSEFVPPSPPVESKNSIIENSYVKRIDELEAEVEGLVKALQKLIDACNRAQDWNGTRIGWAIEEADELLDARKEPKP